MTRLAKKTSQFLTFFLQSNRQNLKKGVIFCQVFCYFLSSKLIRLTCHWRWHGVSTFPQSLFTLEDIMINTVVYILSIVAVNYGFTIVPLVPLPNGEMWPPMSLIVGFIFVVRDFAQREIGHKILLAMLVGGVISWFMATPEVAIASVVAFFASELMDWLAYSFTGYRFSQRILLSSIVSTPVDSAIFLGMIGLFSFSSVIIMTASKMVGALIVFMLVRQRETVKFRQLA